MTSRAEEIGSDPDEDDVEDGESTIEVRHAQILNDPIALQRIRNHQIKRARRARGSIFDFFEYVMREETSRKPLKCAPHQRVALDFVWHHDFAVLMMPPEHSKTYMSAAIALKLMGDDPTMRGTIISATQGQAQKPLLMCKGYIEDSNELHAVYPSLVPSSRPSDPWTQTQITIDRPASIRDATLSAVGFQGAIDGSRLNYVVVDDILNEENTATKEMRDKVFNWIQKSVITRLDLSKPHRFIFTNTAWHPEDAAHRLRDLLGRPTLRMSVSGNIFVEGRYQDPKTGRYTNDPWGCDDEIAKELRPATESPHEKASRLVANDPDPKNEQTLWPEKMSVEVVVMVKPNMLPEHWQQLYEQECRDDSTAMCKQSYIDTSIDVGIAIGLKGLAHRYSGDGPQTAFTGVDLSSGEGKDESGIFTFYVREDRIRVPLGIDYGLWDADEILERIIDSAERYNSIVRVEDNGTQKWIRQMLLNRNKNVPVFDHNTSATKKKDPVFGMRSIFVAMKNGAFAIPSLPGRKLAPEVQKFVNACLFYKPTAHTPDILMAAHFAHAQAAEWGLLSPAPADGPPSFGSLMTR